MMSINDNVRDTDVQMDEELYRVVRNLTQGNKTS